MTAPTRTAPTASSGAWDLCQFQAAVSSSYVPLDVTADHPDSFAGRIRLSSLDDIHVSEVRATEHLVERTPELIARGDQRFFKLSLQLAGSGILIQDGREAVLRPGDLAVYDTDRPYSLMFEQNFRMMVVMFPQGHVDLPTESLRQLTAVRFPAGQGIGGMIAPFLTRMVENLDDLTGVVGGRLARNALDLVTTMFAEELGIKAGGSEHTALFLRIRDYIEAHLATPDLGPTQIAATHFISTRHLHGIFREQGTTVSSWIRARRLERARRDLLDPLLADRSIGAIAARSGFVDAAHFARLFKTAFGESASELRGRTTRHPDLRANS